MWHSDCQRTVPAHARCLGMIKAKSWVVLAFRNNSTMKILTFKNLDTSDTCSFWIKRFVIRSDEHGERRNELSLYREVNPEGTFITFTFP